MSGVNFMLIAEGAHDGGGNVIGLRPDVAGFSVTPEENFFPRCETLWHKMFRQVTYQVSVIGTTGTAPTSWSLGARFEQYIPHTQGYANEMWGWAPIDRPQLVSCIAEGVGWGSETNPQAFGVIADSTTVPDFAASGVLPSGVTVPIAGTTSATFITARVTRSRTVTNQLSGMRVRLNPLITGGDATTRILLSVNAIGIR